jgi:hypothetical protein
MDVKQQKILRIVLGCLLILAVMAVVFVVAGLAFMKSATQVVADIPSPGDKWDAMLMVRNGGAMTDYSTQVSIVPAASRLARGIAIVRAGNVFVADGDHGAVAVDGNGLMSVRVTWVSATELVIAYPPKARVFKQRTRFQSLTIRYE